ncbi:hypothetical protein [Mycobacterium sp. 852002-51057_SCH5723018]|uniref:hypothetical protein n=1 Tax=Mycobacterium sp. 852002-51057_SCH5723018 TaxID=1834094 RepID=UPI0009EEF700
MATGGERPSPGKETVTADDVELAERRVTAARERAAHAGLSAARSIEESARLHERVAKVQEVTVEQGASETGVHRRSIARHREAATDDRQLAEQKRAESQADLSLGPDR